MKQTTKNILGVGAIILLSSGVAGLTTYKLLQSNESAKETSFNEMFKQNPNVKLAAFDAVTAQPVDLTQAAENSLHAVVHIRSTQEAKTRTDLRNETIVTIDGDDAKDLDDAISLRRVKNGNYYLGVHIADVSYYVEEGSELDKEALARGTSIY